MSVAKIVSKDDTFLQTFHHVNVYGGRGSIFNAKHKSNLTKKYYDVLICLPYSYVIFGWLDELPRLSRYEPGFYKAGLFNSVYYNWVQFSGLSCRPYVCFNFINAADYCKNHCGFYKPSYPTRGALRCTNGCWLLLMLRVGSSFAISCVSCGRLVMIGG